MATKYYVTSENNQNPLKDVSFKGAIKTYSFDFSPWAEDNNTVTSITWTNESGQASISGQALANNVATAQVTFAEDGGNLISVLADTGTEKYKVFLDVLAKDPKRQANDYGLCR